ncbi:MAG: signal peptidase I [Candidatus Pacebacteria bacterium]|nr:signal peptidase I [Candidatus Paceibacterota bacterium]
MILTIPIKYFIIEPYVVVGASMSPNFETGHYLIVNKLKNTSKIERGDILVFSSPKDRHISPKLRFTVYFDQRDKYIKRVIGLPFETIKLEGNYVFLKKQNEKEFIKLNEPYLKELGNYRGVTTTLKYDEFFMLGDNRN